MAEETMEIGGHYLLTAKREFTRLKALAEKAIDQISDEKWINVALDKWVTNEESHYCRG